MFNVAVEFYSHYIMYVSFEGIKEVQFLSFALDYENVIANTSIYGKFASNSEFIRIIPNNSLLLL